MFLGLFRHVQLICYKGCKVVLHHPWCWKKKKAEDGCSKKPDSHYITTLCWTQGCVSPIVKIEVYSKDSATPQVFAVDHKQATKVLNHVPETNSRNLPRNAKEKSTMTDLTGSDLDSKHDKVLDPNEKVGKMLISMLWRIKFCVFRKYLNWKRCWHKKK